MEGWTPLQPYLEKWATTHGTRDGHLADAQHDCDAGKEAAARQEGGMQFELDALSHELYDRAPADAQHHCDAEKEGEAGQENHIQLLLDALAIDSHMEDREGDNPSNLDRADAQHDCDPQEEEAARQEGDVQFELDPSFDDLIMRFTKPIESNQQESDTLAAAETALVHQLKEVQYHYSLLARLDLSRAPTISAHPIDEIEAIVTRAIRFTQSTSDVEAARILNSMNSDLPIGTQLIADMSADVYILIGVPWRVHIFDKPDILCIEYDSMYRVRLIMKGWSLELCCGMNAQDNWLCEQWLKKYAEGVAATYVRG